MIQNRSTSTRLPNKSEKVISGKTLTEWVIHAANGSSIYLNKWALDFKIFSRVIMAIPEGDPLKKYAYKCQIIEGPEQDVLSRFMKVDQTYKPDDYVRITADCPLIYGNLITKHVQTYLKHGYDYFSNVDPDFRTFPDGFDCEVFSSRLLNWANEATTDKYHREHVTTIMRKTPPDWAKIGHMVGFIYLPNLKLSVDTEEDLERVREHFDGISKITRLAKSRYGEGYVHRY